MRLTRGAWGICSVVLLTLLCLPSFAEPVSVQQSTKGVITGTVVDGSGAILKGAEVRLLPLGIFSVTNNVGVFTFPVVSSGHYTVKISYVGFESKEVAIDVVSGKGQNLNLKLDVANKKEEILVTAERAHGEAEAINETRMADNILQVLPAEVIVSLPNANAADAIGRLPSVTLYRIEGEGVYIQVRGTEPRLTNVTVDGITIPAPEPTVRQVRLDVLPSSMIEAVELNKTLSANQDANGIGGSVNLRTKTAGDRPTIDAFADGGYTNIMNGRGSTAEGLTVGNRFGKTKRFGILINGAYDYNGRGIDNFQPALDPYSTFAAPFYDSNTIREYRYYRYRYGFSGAADYRLSDNTSFYANGIYSDLKDWGDKWYYKPVSQVLASTGVYKSTAAKAPAFYTSSKRPNASVGTIILGGRHTTNKSWLTFEASSSYSYEVSSAGNPKADFQWIGTSLGNTCDYSLTGSADKYHPHFGNCDTSANSPLLNATNWGFLDITTSKGRDSQLNLTAATSYARNYNVDSHFGTFEAGFKFTNGHKAQDATETVYDTASSNGTWLPANIPMTAVQSDFHNSDYFAGQFFGGNFGPVSDFNKLLNLTNPTVTGNIAGAVNGYKTAAASYPNIFHTVEQITAGYAMNTIDFGKLHVQTGLRFENTQMDTLGYTVKLYPAKSVNCPGGTAVTDTGCGIPQAVTNNPGYLDILPSVQLRYAVTQNSSLRAVYARGVARPDPYQLVPYVTEDDSSSPATVSIGNPKLKPEHANNYDLLYENALHPLGLLQVGVFAKQVTAPQVLFTIPASITIANLPAGSIPSSMLTTVQQYSTSGKTDQLSQYINGENAYLYGIEASYQQHLSFLPWFLSGLGINANYSYTDSQEKGLPLRIDHPRMLDQASVTWKISPSYDTKRLSLRAGFAYDGRSLFSYNYISPVSAPGAGADPSGLGVSGPSGDVWTLAHYQVDAQASYRIWRGLSAKVVGLNLNNEVFGYYQGSDQFVNQREYYKATYTAGLRYNFAQGK
jgi:TonB-dependent receptor